MRTLLIAGATGLVGSHVLEQALAGSSFDRIVAPTRRPLPAHERVVNPILDFDHLPEDAVWWAADAYVSALGTTRAQAGSAAATVKVEHDLPLAMATLAREHGVLNFALCSAGGANPRSAFHYMRTKGKLEEDIIALEFSSLTIARPAMIGGRRTLRRGEGAMLAFLSALDPLLPKRLRINPAAAIARALLDSRYLGVEGTHIISSDQLTGSRAERRGQS